MTRVQRSFVSVIACGGLAERFGGDKAGQMVGGRTLLDRAVSAAEGFGAPVALAARTPDQVQYGDLPTLADSRPDLGPIGALQSGFAFASRKGSSHLLLIACDQPFLPADLAPCLLNAIGKGGVALPVSGGHDQNMSALWRCDARALETYLESGKRSLWRFAEMVGIVRVPWEQGAADPFADIDTRADLAEAEQRIRGE